MSAVPKIHDLYVGRTVMGSVLLVWGVLLDVAIWGVWPSLVTLLGGAIVIGAGLYLIARERRGPSSASTPVQPSA